MKNNIYVTVIALFAFYPSFAQKTETFWDKSNLSFSYGLSFDYFADVPDGGGPGNTLDLSERDSWGQIFGFEYGYRRNEKNEFGFGFSKQVHRREYNQAIQTNFTTINFEEFLMRNSKNFHSVHWKRHLIKDKLMSTVGLYNLWIRDEWVGLIANSDETIVNLRNETVSIDFGVWLGLEYYYDIRNFQVGIRSRLFYTQGYGFDSFESFEISPVVRFRL